MTAPARPYLFDARSAGWSRTTGWERYAREVAGRLAGDPLVQVRTAGSERVGSRLWQDAVATPAAARSARVVHYPTFPPVPWAAPGRTVLYTLHDLTWWLHAATASRMGRHYYRRLAQHAALGRAHIVTDTAAVADEVVAHFGIRPERVSVVPLGVELPDAATPMVRDRPYLLTVATLEPRKNLVLLAEAFRRSGLGRTPDLVVVGRAGWGERPEHVEVVSGLDDSGLAAAYAGADALLLPSLYEGFGLPVVEAMQSGLPVVCSDLPVLREVSGGFATYVDPHDVQAWANAIRIAVSSAQPDGARAWAVETWQWRRTVDLLGALYRRLDPAGSAVHR